MRDVTVAQTLQLLNPKVAMLYEYVHMRYLQEMQSAGTVNDMTPMPFPEFAHKFLLQVVDGREPVMAIRSILLGHIDFKLKPVDLHMPLLDALAAEF